MDSVTKHYPANVMPTSNIRGAAISSGVGYYICTTTPAMNRIFIFLILFVFHSAVAQKEDYMWAFGHGGGLNFNTNPVSVFHSSMDAGEGCASVSDGNGQLLFYTNGETVWNRYHNIMLNGGGLDGNHNHSSSCGITVVQSPAAANLYYIFVSSEREEDPDNKLRYNIVDMNGGGGQGNVVTKNVIIDSGTSELSTIMGNVSCYKWLVVHMRNNNSFHAFKISATGLDTNPVVSSGGLFNEQGAYWIGFLQGTNDNTKIYCETSEGAAIEITTSIQRFDFDMATGKVSNAQTLFKPCVPGVFCSQYYSVALSADNSKLYWIDYSFSRTTLYQAEVNLPNSVAINHSATVVDSVNVPNFAGLRLGPDGRIYIMPHYGGNLLSFIPDPELKAPACGFLRDALALFNGATCGTTFPNTILTNNLQLKHSVVSCTDTAVLKSLLEQASYVWSTGATSASIRATQDGVYWVRAFNTCGTRTDTFHVVFNAVHAIPLHDTITCDKPVLLNPGVTDATSVIWQDTGWSNTFNVIWSGTYHLEINRRGCVYRDTAVVTIYTPLPKKLLRNDVVFCDVNAFPFVIYPIVVDLPNYTWSDQSTAGSLTVTQPGVYKLRSTTPCDTVNDSIRISFCLPVIENATVSENLICAGSCIDFGAVTSHAPETYEWFFPGGKPGYTAQKVPPTVCYDTAGRYTAVLIIKNPGGSDTAYTNVEVLPKPVAAFADSALVVPYKTRLLFIPCGDANEILWYENDSLVCQGCKTLELDAKKWKSRYYCVLRNGNCTDTCSYEIMVTGIPADLWLPDAFTPNGDGLNDRFGIITDNPNIQVTSLSIFNRWGQRVYATMNSNKGWDGTQTGRAAETGVYYYMLSYRVAGKDDTYSRRGEVTLVR